MAQKLGQIMAILFIIVVIASVFVGYSFLALDSSHEEMPELLVGVDVAYDDMEEIKALVDEISPYTNTLVVGSAGITFNVTKLDEVCTYVYDKGMYFMTYMHPQDDYEQLNLQRQWVEDARTKWGERFLGLYAYDEMGGRQLDNATYRPLTETPENYTDAAVKYITAVNNNLVHIRESPINSGNLPLFTSDYALYWFDYKGGYDVVFAEFGWNYSRQLNVALDRGVDIEAPGGQEIW